MKRITATVPDGFKETLEAISVGRGSIKPNISAEVTQALAEYINKNGKLARKGRAMKSKGGK